MPDLVICVRCHKDPTLIIDTIDAARHYTDPDTTVIMAAVDGFPKVAERLRDCNIPTYCSPRNNGWGAGLFTLLMESIWWSVEHYGKSHFLTIDYDTLFLQDGVDEYLLNRIVDSEIGLIGKYLPDSGQWRGAFFKEQARMVQVLGAIPDSYMPGEGCQGGCMLLTQSLIKALGFNGFFSFPKLNAKDYTSIADDHFISLVCRICGLEINDGGPGLCCGWKAFRDPRGAEEEGVYVFHPIKMVTAFGAYNRTTDLQLRNYFRQLRGRSPLV